MSEAIILNSLHGKAFGIGLEGHLIANTSPITSRCADATITVGDESANARAVTIQLLDSKGNDIDYVEKVDVVVFTTAARTAFSSGGSTGVAIGTDGLIVTHVAKQVFVCFSEADGDIDLTYTDTGTDAAFLALYLPTGRIIMSTVMTNA